MADEIDPKLKTLSDILAMVLQDQPGESAAALAAVRRRAQQDGVTGGMLKDLFRQLQTTSTPLRGPTRSGAWRSAGGRAGESAQTAVLDLERRLAEAGWQLSRERRNAALLRDRLHELETGVLADRPPPVLRIRGNVGTLERQVRRAQALEDQLSQRETQVSQLQAAVADLRQVRTRSRRRLALAMLVALVAVLSADGARSVRQTPPAPAVQPATPSQVRPGGPTLLRPIPTVLL